MSAPFAGMPPAVNVQQSILFAQLAILRQITFQREGGK